jgi:integrase
LGFRRGSFMAYIQQRTGTDGRTSYRVQVRLKGHRPETATFERKTDAKRWAQDIESAMRAGRHFKTAEAKRHSLSDLIDRYIRDVLPTKPKSASTQVIQLHWWREALGSSLLSDLSPPVIVEARDRLTREPSRGRTRSAATVNRYMAALSHALSVAKREWGWIEENPALNVTRPKEPKGRTRFLSDDERDRLLDACQSSDNPCLYPVVVLALASGMRQGEILGLTWDRVDLNQGRITLYETKNGETRVVPLSGHPLAVLKDHSSVRRIDTNLVFPGKRTRNRRSDPTITPLDIRSPWEKAVKAANVEDFRFHDLRHSAASYLAMNGASPTEIAEVLGHKTLQMVKRYAHLSEAHTAKVVASMNEKIFGQ